MQNSFTSNLRYIRDDIANELYMDARESWALAYCTTLSGMTATPPRASLSNPLWQNMTDVIFMLDTYTNPGIAHLEYLASKNDPRNCMFGIQLRPSFDSAAQRLLDKYKAKHQRSFGGVGTCC